jgi:hypothetical protein
MNFVIFQVGENILPRLLVKSIRKYMPDAHVIQLSDYNTEKLDGADVINRYDGDFSNLMTFRLEAYSNLDLKEKAVYLDSDMLILSKFDLAEFSNSDVVLCKRTFDIDAQVNTAFRGMDLSLYEGKTLNDAWPYLACFTVTNDASFWRACRDELISLDPQFHFWYGDQEAIKRVNKKSQIHFGYARESLYACLPEYIDRNSLPYIAHFKGAKRKDMMIKLAQEILI